MWRKNRRPAPAERDGDESCIGVDLNRNFDFLWDFAKAFDPDAPVACSTKPCDPEVYVGPRACSEPETRNVVWLLDKHPEIAYLVDMHSYGELIMYSWGDDENQTREASMTFANRAWDGKRGMFDDKYREFLLDDDRQLLVRLGTAMQAGIAASRGRRYAVQQSANLYPTAGTSDDYSYSRHLVDPTLTKVLAFTVEWGSEDNPTPFHPPYEEMKKIIAEVTSGLLAFCGEAARISAANHYRRCHNDGASRKKPVQAEWNILVFLNAKNNLEPFSFKNFEQMAKVGSTDKVNVLVEFGRPQRHYTNEFGAWSKTLRFRVEKDMEPTEDAAIEDLGAVNMGDGAALADFVTWARTRLSSQAHHACDLGPRPRLAAQQRAQPCDWSAAN